MEAEQKKTLKPLCLTLRHLLEGRYDEQGNWHGGDLEERMNALGVWWDRDPIPAAKMPFRTPEDRHAREVIDAYLALREDAGVSRKDAIEEFVREAAYTWANRLLVLRCMEARDLIDGVVATKEVYGGRSLAHHRLAQRHPELCTGEDGGLFAMLDEAFSFHAKNLPLLFDPKAPAVALRPSVAALKKCIALLSGTESVNGNGPATDEVFAAPDALGWAYQYWNTEEKDRVFEKVRTKKAKIQGADIIPATQLYTEPYMVKFLVQNSLGATWMGMYPDSDLSAGWEYYVKDADRAPVRRKNVENITFLDPACGSGHFLLEAFDLFYQMYEAEGKYTDPATICKKILARNLYGIDIDERAVQIARAALWMKAAERVFDFSGTPKNIIATNIRLPKGKDHLKAFLAKHPEDAPLQPALETIFEGLAHADELGSLLQIEEPVEKELRWLRERLGGQTTLATGGLTGQTRFAGQMTDEDWDAWKDGVIERLADHFTAEAEAADLVNAFFSQNAGKGVRLFELLSKRYDVVAANPPYMGSSNLAVSIKNYIQMHYPEGKRDIYTAFILRNINLCRKSGRIAMITQQSWMFLKSYSNLRSNEGNLNFKGILRTVSIESLVHLGPGAFEEVGGAVVNSVLFIFSNNPPSKDQKIIAYRLIAPKSSTDKKNQLILSLKSSISSNKYSPLQKRHLSLPLSIIAYWLNDKIIEKYEKCDKFIDFAESKAGLTTGNSLKYFRKFWELRETKTWLLLSNGGSYSRWYGNEEDYLRWDEGIQSILSHIGNKLPSREYYQRSGLSISQAAQGSIGCTLLDNAAFTNSSVAIFPKRGFDRLTLAANLNSRIASFFLRVISQKIGFEARHLDFLPISKLQIDDIKKIEYICLIKKKQIEREITNIYFNPDYFEEYSIFSNFIYEIHRIITESYIEERLFISLDFHDSIDTIIPETGAPAGWHPLILSYDNLLPHPKNFPNVPREIYDYLAEHKRRILSADDLATLKANLRTLYEAGQGAKVDIEDDNTSDDSEGETIAGAYIPIPPETFLEELSQKLEVHPISVYWLLKEGIEQEGWRCIPEERRITADRFTVMILRMLGHRWPKQIEAGEPVPDWADADGIIPLTSDTGEATLLERVRARIAAEFPGGSPAAIEREFEEVMGKSLEDWLHLDFFKHHTKQFKKRPIAWQVQSGRFTKKKQPAFACMVYYHKLDEDSLHKIKNQYVGPLRQKYETEMRGIEGIPVGSRTETQEKRYRELTDLVAELKVFGDALSAAAENGFSSKVLDRIAKKEPLDAWCSIDGRRPAPADQDAFLRQERAYIPDINDGVRVNVAPLQKAGLLAVDVIAKKDLEKAISDRAEWRADERRWCREGKLPKCGWWPQEEAP